MCYVDCYIAWLSGWLFVLTALINGSLRGLCVFFSFLLANFYWSIVVSITWHHCWRSAARRQAKWMPVLKGWTSQEMLLNHVLRGRPFGLLHFAGGLLIAATMTLQWSSSYDLLASWPKRSLLMRTNLEAAEHPVALLNSVFVTWRVYGIWSILLWHRMSEASILSESCLVTVQVSQQYSRMGSIHVNHVEANFCAKRDWWLPNMAVKLCHAITSYADSSPDFCVTASISVLCTFEIDEGLYKFHICVAYSNRIFSVWWTANLLRVFGSS